MAEVTVAPQAKETIITLGDGTVVSATISQETLSVVSEKADPVVIELNNGPRGQPGSAILVGTGYPLMSQGSIGDIFLSTGGVNVGAVFKKTETQWTEEGNVRGPAGGIESVNGDFGPGVILDQTDIGLEFVDNTSDADKPVSTATQTALNLKANASDTVNLTGAQTIAGVKTFSSAPVVPDASWAISKTSGLQAALDLKAIDTTVVHLAGTETISGAKTFSESVTIGGTKHLLFPNGSYAAPSLTTRSTGTKIVVYSTLSATESEYAIGLETNYLWYSAGQIGAGHKWYTTSTNTMTLTNTGNLTITGTFTGNGSGLTNLSKSAAGLGNVDNTSDAAKPVSTAQQTALNLKANLASPTFTGTVAGITAAMVGLGNVSNLAQVDLVNAQTIAGVKTFSASPIVPTPTTATQAANKTYVDTTVNALVDAAPGTLDTLNELAAALGDDPNFATTMTNNLALKAPLASPTFTGTVSGITKTMVGLANVDNTSDAAKPVSTAQQTALNLKANLASPTFTGTVSGITAAMVTGAVDTTTTQTIAGSKTFTGATLTVAPAGTAIVQIGRTDGVASTPRIEFNSGATAVDYDTRIYAGGGTGTAGQGTLYITAATLDVTGAVDATSFTGSGAGLTSLSAASLTGTILQARMIPNIQRFEHGATASTARPTGSTYVEWVGSVQPTNMVTGDTWINTSASGNVSDNFPSGMVMSSASAKTAAPSGWYWLEGQQILISGDTALYNEITNNGATFPYGANTNGAGAAGSTHFRLPDARGKVIAHADGTTEFAGIGTVFGSKTYTMTAANLIQHNHGVNDPGHAHGTSGRHSTWGANNSWGTTDIYFNATAYGGDGAAANYLIMGSSWTGTHSATTGITTQNAGSASPTAMNNIQPTLTLRYMIKR